MNASKNKGTWAETQLVRWLTGELGITFDRLTQRGAGDIGDIGGIDWLMIEVKNEKLPHLTEWRREVERQCANKNTALGVVLWSPPGVGAKNIDKWIALEFEPYQLSASVDVPFVGTLNRLHRFVHAVDGWGTVALRPDGSTPPAEWEYGDVVYASTLACWIEDLRSMIVGRSFVEAR